MNIKAIASALAISSTMLLSGLAYADTMVGSMTVTDADLPKVQERCDQLALAADTSSPTDTTTKGTDDTAGAAATTPNAEEVNAAADATASIDLESVTLESCKAAGLTQ